MFYILGFLVQASPRIEEPIFGCLLTRGRHVGRDDKLQFTGPTLYPPVMKHGNGESHIK